MDSQFSYYTAPDRKIIGIIIIIIIIIRPYASLTHSADCRRIAGEI